MTEVAKKKTETTFEAVRSRMDLEASMSGSDRASLKDWIEAKVAAIVDADSVADINALAVDSGLTASKTLVGRTFEVQDFALQESAEQYRENSVFQKVVYIQAVDLDTGEEMVIDGGGDTFIAQLVSMRDHFGFPFQGTILAKQTGSGNELLYWRMSVKK